MVGRSCGCRIGRPWKWLVKHQVPGASRGYSASLRWSTLSAQPPIRASDNTGRARPTAKRERCGLPQAIHPGCPVAPQAQARRPCSRFASLHRSRWSAARARRCCSRGNRHGNPGSVGTSIPQSVSGLRSSCRQRRVFSSFTVHPLAWMASRKARSASSRKCLIALASAFA
jgi:hypothetical protein